jgi:basic membrane lipoprotein Med (substrate-binding protein (PBP1-ABC) superfamily)
VRGSFSSTLLVLSLGAACAGEPAVDDPESFRVALLTPGPISDQEWNGEAYRGLLALRDSMGASISHIQTRTPASFDENFREYGRQSYDLVIGHGFEYKDAAERIAPSFPNTVFLTGTVRLVMNERLRDRIAIGARLRLDSVWKEMVAGSWRSPVSWTAPRP